MEGIIKRTISSNFYYLIGHAIGKIFSFFIFLLVARLLGVSGFGGFSHLLSLVGIFSLLPDFGISYLSIRETAGESREFIQQFFNRVFSLKINLAVFSFIAIFLD